MAKENRKNPVKRSAVSSFPALFFRSDDLANLSSLATGDLSTEFSRVEAGAERDIAVSNYPPANQGDAPTDGGVWRNYGDRLFNAAFAAKFTSNATSATEFFNYCSSVATTLSSYTDWGPTAQDQEGLAASHIMAGMSVFVDLFYDQLSKEFREDLLSRINTQLDIHKSVIITEGREWVKGKTSNINQIFWWGFLFGSIVNYIHSGDRTYRGYILSSIDNTNQCFQLRNGQDTASDPENLFYMSYSLHGLIQTVDVLKNLGLADYESSTWLQNIYKMYMYAYLPDYLYQTGYGDQNGLVGRGPQHLLAYLENLTSDGEIGFIRDSLWNNPAVNQFGNPNTGILCLDFLWKNPAITSSTPTLSSVYNFTDWGVGVYKEDLASSAATYLSFKAANPAGNYAWQLWRDGDPLMSQPIISHEHADQGSFIYQPSGLRFIDGALYNRYKKTSIGNALTFFVSSQIDFKYTDAQIATIWDLTAINELAESRDEINQAGVWENFLAEDEMIANNLVGGNVSATLTPMSSGVSGEVFVAGEYHRWYPSSVDLSAGGTYETELSSVYRSLLKLPNDVLCIVDHIDIGPSKALAPRAYFNANSSAVYRNRIFDGGSNAGSYSALFAEDTGGSTSSTLFCASGPVTPSGMTISRSVTDLEDVPGTSPKSVDKAGGWNALPVYQWYTRFEYDNLSGMNQMIYAAVPHDKTANIHTISSDDDSVTFTVECSDGNTYSIQIASKDDSSVRNSVFGNPNTYYTLS